jgi:hypothetical protein
MRIVILSVLVIFMNCSSSKPTGDLEESSDFSQSFNGKDIVSFFDKSVRTGLNVQERSQMDEVFLNETRSASQRDSYSVRSFDNNITNLRKKDNFILLKKDSVFMKLDLTSSDRFIFKGKIKMIDSYYNKKNKAQVFKYKISEKKFRSNLLVSYFKDKNVIVKLKGKSYSLYKGTWGEYKKPSLTNKSINKFAK